MAQPPGRIDLAHAAVGRRTGINAVALILRIISKTTCNQSGLDEWSMHRSTTPNIERFCDLLDKMVAETQSTRY